MNIYQEKGFKDRDDYLEYLADEYEVEFEYVYELAEFLGPNEDFDGLVNELEEYRPF